MIKISYRDNFVQSIKEQFTAETAAYRRKEKAENLIYEYFGDLLEELYDETEASNEKLNIEYENIKLNGIELKLTFINNSVEISKTTTDNGEKIIIDLLEDNGTVYFSKEHQKELNEELLDKYLQMAFEESLS
jgi:hypothetical protein